MAKKSPEKAEQQRPDVRFPQLDPAVPYEIFFWGIPMWPEDRIPPFPIMPERREHPAHPF